MIAAEPPEAEYLTANQVKALLQPLAAERVQHMDGMSHLEGWDVRAQLSRVFGFARWSADLIDLTMLYEEEGEPRSVPGRKPQPTWRCAYRATVRLTICAPAGNVLATYTEAAAGTNMGMLPHSKREEAHDMAIKTAETQALKRAAVNLGTRFGLSLYNDGDTADVVMRTLVAGVEANPPEAVPHPAAIVSEPNREEPA